MKNDYKCGTPIALSCLDYGEIFSHCNELFMKINFDDHVDMYAVALRNGNLVPFSQDPIVVWEDCTINKRRRRKK